jgi:hypothetical protein
LFVLNLVLVASSICSIMCNCTLRWWGRSSRGGGEVPALLTAAAAAAAAAADAEAGEKGAEAGVVGEKGPAGVWAAEGVLKGCCLLTAVLAGDPCMQ